MLRRQKHVLSQSTTPFACTLFRVISRHFVCQIQVNLGSFLPIPLDTIFWKTWHPPQCAVNCCRDPNYSGSGKTFPGIPGRNYIRPPPLPLFLAKRHFPEEGGGGVYFEAPRGRNFIRPPLLYTPHPYEGIFRGGGVGVYKIRPRRNEFLINLLCCGMGPVCN